MHLCAQLEGSICTVWVEHTPLLSLPEGFGIKVGGLFFGLALTGYLIQFVVNFILNRR